VRPARRTDQGGEPGLKTRFAILVPGVALACGVALGSSASLTWLDELYRWASRHLDSGTLSALALAANLVLLTVLVVVGRHGRPEDPTTRQHP
jgi:hypothetical protein